jgi:glucose dehydrogenase
MPSVQTKPQSTNAPALRPVPGDRLLVRALIALAICAVASFESARAETPAANVDAARITGADRDSANWMTYGRTYSEQRFSPLARISADNVKHLGLAWYADLDTDRGQEATPLEIDGVLYVSTAWSIVKAYDAKTGTLLWSYDPAVRLLPRWPHASLRSSKSDWRSRHDASASTGGNLKRRSRRDQSFCGVERTLSFSAASTQPPPIARYRLTYDWNSWDCAFTSCRRALRSDCSALATSR